MTAMPPTMGHLSLVKFAAGIANKVTVIVTTQPHEPYTEERYNAVKQACAGLDEYKDERMVSTISVVHLHKELPQDPETEGFWNLWHSLVGMKGFLNIPARKGDFFVTSEPYGAKLAELTGATFMPFDPKRELVYTKGTRVRAQPYKFFNDMIPEFQKYLRLTVTVWGAESTGKTTLSKEVAGLMDTHWVYEYARPYLETVGPEINTDCMNAIWRGQKSVQKMAQNWTGKPYIVQDTDLFSTVGYWEQPHWEAELGPVPEGLIKDAQAMKSDLYLITRSNIDFEEDPIRYGGDHRESPDAYWIALADKYNLNYVILNEKELMPRVAEAMAQLRKAGKEKGKTIAYDRKGM